MARKKNRLPTYSQKEINNVIEKRLRLRNVGVLTDIMTANQDLIERPASQSFPSFEEMAMSATAAIQILAINYLHATRSSTMASPIRATYMLDRMREVNYILRSTVRSILKTDTTLTKRTRNTSKLKNVSR